MRAPASAGRRDIESHSLEKKGFALRRSATSATPLRRRGVVRVNGFGDSFLLGWMSPRGLTTFRRLNAALKIDNFARRIIERPARGRRFDYDFQAKPRARARVLVQARAPPSFASSSLRQHQAIP
jgi:hypothetical protein